MQAFKVKLDLWYHPIEEDIYFIIGLSRREEVWPQFLELAIDIAGEIQLVMFQDVLVMALSTLQISKLPVVSCIYINLVPRSLGACLLL